jgi:hypothetical protein
LFFAESEATPKKATQALPALGATKLIAHLLGQNLLGQNRGTRRQVRVSCFFAPVR